MRRFCLLLAAFAACAGAAAYPEGAPWGAADPAATESCLSCHFDGDAVDPSDAISIFGLPATAEPGRTYALVLKVASEDAAVAGFQLLASTDGQEAGLFGSPEVGVEHAGAAVRSTVPVPIEEAEWSLLWSVPQEAGTSVTLLLAVTASNDDGSPLGDVVHYRSYIVPIE